MLILASTSPRRYDLLRAWGYKFSQQDVNVAEVIPEGIYPREGVKLIALRKAKACADRLSCAEGQPAKYDEPVILAADTLIVFRGLVLGKPRDRAQACEMLRMLSGHTHMVMTGVAVIKQGVELTQAQVTLVQFSQLSDEVIEGYLDTGEWTDKAAGYAIQGQGKNLISNFKGSESNVIGLPMDIVVPMLDSFGVLRRDTEPMQRWHLT